MSDLSPPANQAQTWFATLLIEQQLTYWQAMQAQLDAGTLMEADVDAILRRVPADEWRPAEEAVQARLRDAALTAAATQDAEQDAAAVAAQAAEAGIDVALTE